MKKTLSLLLAIVMVLSMLPNAVFAEDATVLVPGEAQSITVPAGGSVDVTLTAENAIKVTFNAGFRNYNYSVEVGGETYAAYMNGVCEASLEAGTHTMKVTNAGEYDLTIEVIASYPTPGTMDMPGELTVPGENAVTTVTDADGMSSYYWLWTASADGELTVSISTEAAGWTYMVNNLTAGVYGDMHWSDDAEPVTSETVTVSAGDEVEIQVSSYDPVNGMYGAPEMDVTVTTVWTPAESGEVSGPVVLALGDNTVAVPADETGVTATYTAEQAGVLNITVPNVNPMMLMWSYSFTLNGEMCRLGTTVEVAEGDELVLVAASTSGEASELVLNLSYLEPGANESFPKEVEYNSNFQGYLMNTTLEAGDDDGFWYTFEAHKSGVIYVETSSAIGYTVTLTDSNWNQMTSDEGNPIISYRVNKGDVVTISVMANYDENWEIPGGSVNVFAAICDGNEEDPVPVKSTETFKVPVASGDSVAIIDNAKGVIAEAGLEISGYSEAIAVTTVTVNGATYTDVDGDGKIEIDLNGDYYNRPVITITNGHEWNISYTVNVVDGAAEDVPTCPCGAEVAYTAAVEAACHYTGNTEYWYCAACDVYYADAECTQVTNYKNVVIPATNDGLLVHMDAVEPACHYEGNIEYWICYTCEQVWQDEALTQLTNIKNVVLPSLGGETVHVEAVAGDCMTMGNIEHWYCESCGQFWQDEALTQITNAMSVKLGLGEHDLVHVEAVEAGCHMTGNVEHWYCTVCETVWSDEELTQVTNHMNVIVPALGGETVHVEAVEPDCMTEGNIEHWYCETCEQVWQDEALTQLTNHMNVKLGLGEHDLVHVDAVEAGCHMNGNVEHWYCTVCGGVWTDEALTQMSNHLSVVIPALGGETVHVEAVEPGCHYDGNIEHWYCNECETVWADEALTQVTNHKNVILPATGEGNVVYFEAVEPGCHYEGNIEYWVCYTCEQVWQDEALTQLTNIKNVVLPALKTEATHVEAKAPTCYENGNIEYWYCDECGQVWQDAALTQLTNIKNVVVPAQHTLVHMEAVEPGCHYDGHIEHWYCTECETVWADEALTQITNHKNVILPATGEGNVVHMDAVEPGCHYDGNIEYWICYTCEQVWQDEALTQLTNIKNVVVPAVGGDVVHVEAVKNTCWTDGNIEYWYCENCEQVWQDEALTQLTNHKNVILGALNHINVIHFAAVEPGCHYNGNIEYWYCPDCEGFWADEALTQVTNSKSVILPATGEGNVVHMDAVEPGCHQDGNIEYWVCYDCEQVWQDEALTQLTNIKNVVVPATGEGNLVHIEATEPGCHSLGNIEYWVCYTCESFWADEALTQVTNSKNVILPATGSENMIHFEAVEPACHFNGNIEYWFCAECEGYWQDEACTQLTNAKRVILPALGGEVVHVEAVAPTCMAEGNIEHWYCESCEQVWQNEELTQLTNHKNVILGTVDHNLVHIEAVEPGCHFTGNVEHWYCTMCGTVWADEALTQITNHLNVIVPAVGGEVVHVEAVDPTCTSEGNIEHWYCESCEQVWQNEELTQLTNHKNVILPAAEHNLVHMDAVEPGCHFTGNIEHWYCTVCETVWADEALTQVTNHLNVIVPALGGEVVHVEAVDPTCTSEGNIEHWYCETCEQVWQDEALTQLTNHKNVIIGASEHTLVHMDAVEPGCHYTGNVEHWYCTVCGTVWADEALTQITNHLNVILPATGSENVVHFDAVEPGCHFNGNVEYWYCPDCEGFWTDEACTKVTNSKSVVLPATGGDVVHVEAKDAGCYEDGNVEHWYCETCEQVWADEALTQLTNHKNVIIGAAHTLVHVEAKDAACHGAGNIEYWYCSVCNDHFLDEYAHQNTNSKSVLTPALGSENVEHYEANEATCEENGNIEFWYCADCDTFFADEACTMNVAYLSMVIPATGHEYVNGVCTVCGIDDPEFVEPENPTEEPDEPTEEPTDEPTEEPTEEPEETTKPSEDEDNDDPDTGDNAGIYAAGLFMSLMAMIALAVVSLKKKLF